MLLRILGAVYLLAFAIEYGAGCGPDNTNQQWNGYDLAAGAEGDLAGADLSATAPDLAPACPSQILCGPLSACCAAGEECVDDQCFPACANARCGTGCCAMGQVCLYANCTNPGAACQESLDCAENEFCEPTLLKCLPQAPQSGDGGAAAGVCEYRPPVLPYNPVVEWSWTSSATKPTFNQVINTPVVIDLDKDKIPDVVIVTSVGYTAGGAAYLRALDGKTGLEKWPATADVYLDANRVSPRGTPAAADLDGDGTIEIVAPKMGGGLIAFNANGSFRWRSTKTAGGDYDGAMNSPTVAIADMNHDGKAEIVVGAVVLDYTGKIIFGEGNEFAGTNSPGYGAVSILADVDNDTVMEVLTGQAAWKLNGTKLWDCAVTTFCGFGAAPPDGYPAISDLDDNGTPELIVIANGNVRIQNAVTGAKIADAHDMPGTGLGGPPTVADFDGDGKMDFSSANGTSYNVFGFAPSPSPHVIDKWSKTTQDGSSNVTGSSVFDFEGDGQAEVVYGDECYFRVYRGSDGFELFKVASSSATIHEYPVLVDVDGDNRTEVVVVANDANHVGGSVDCNDYVAGETFRHGVFVYGDANNKWVRTRKLWNQHAYHITNIDSDGKLPNPEPDSWKNFNNYRVSAQGAGVFNAPDLAVDLEVSTATCPDALTLRARVKNLGALGVGSGVKVDFYLGSDATGMLIGSGVTMKALLPGESDVVSVAFTVAGQTPPFSFFVVVDGGASAINECREDNNGASTPPIACPIVG
jgi:hypothetical protein